RGPKFDLGPGDLDYIAYRQRSTLRGHWLGIDARLSTLDRFQLECLSVSANQGNLYTGATDRDFGLGNSDDPRRARTRQNVHRSDGAFEAWQARRGVRLFTSA